MGVCNFKGGFTRTQHLLLRPTLVSDKIMSHVGKGCDNVYNFPFHPSSRLCFICLVVNDWEITLRRKLVAISLEFMDYLRGETVNEIDRNKSNCCNVTFSSRSDLFSDEYKECTK